ncbi:MAG: FHA domain-containing protein [Pyrinomonadaceae bacterium]
MAVRFVIKQNGSKQTAGENPAIAEYVFDENLFTIGSDAANHLVLAESAAEQAVVVREDEFLTLINRAEGTALNGKPLRREAFQPLDDGDRIEIGTYTIFVFDSEAEKPEDFLSAGDMPVVAEIPKPFEPLLLSEELSGNETAAVMDTNMQEPVAPAKSESSRNFAAILDTLRTEEDSFYFVVEDEAQKETRRIPLELTEMPIGADQRGKISVKIKEISIVFAVARKDWSGILLESNKPNTVFVNGEAVIAPRRLRNDDHVSFSAPIKETLVLHEPSSLVALESLLTTRDASEARFGIHKTGSRETESLTAATEKPKNSLFERTFFGYFSFLEVVTMIFATLICAVLIFLFLEFMFT